MSRGDTQLANAEAIMRENTVRIAEGKEPIGLDRKPLFAPTIKPCPFCGKVPPVKDHPGDYGYSPPSVSVRCLDCRCGFSDMTEKWSRERGTYSVYDEARAGVLARWNTRA